MAKKKRYVDWVDVWQKFDRWYETRERKCPHCGSREDGPGWDEQQKKIEQIVEKALRGLLLPDRTVRCVDVGSAPPDRAMEIVTQFTNHMK